MPVGRAEQLGCVLGNDGGVPLTRTPQVHEGDAGLLGEREEQTKPLDSESTFFQLTFECSGVDERIYFQLALPLRWLLMCSLIFASAYSRPRVHGLVSTRTLSLAQPEGATEKKLQSLGC
jgi:hypothetical protein